MPDIPEEKSEEKQPFYQKYAVYIIIGLIITIIIILKAKEIPKEAYYVVASLPIAYVLWSYLMTFWELNLQICLKHIDKEWLKNPYSSHLDTSNENVIFYRYGNQYVLGFIDIGLNFVLTENLLKRPKIVGKYYGTLDDFYDWESKETEATTLLKHGYPMKPYNTGGQKGGY